MALALDLERVLLHILPMPAMMAQGQLLGMPNHMEMIRDRLWNINGTILDAQLRALKEPELEEWVTDVGAAIVDVDDLLGRILDWHPRRGAAAASNRSSRSICSIRVASRQAILLELKEMVRRLNCLVRRGSVLGLSKEILESVDPRQEEEYSTVLREEVVGRNEDVEKIIDILQQQQSGDRDEWLLIDGNNGKTTLARLIYHHPWVQEQFQHRIWVDVPNNFYLDPMWIMREFTRSITGEPCEDIWLFFDGIQGSKYLLVLDDLYAGEEKDKWLQSESFLLLVGVYIWLSIQDDVVNNEDVFHVLASEGLLSYSDIVGTERKYMKAPDSALFLFSVIKYCYILTKAYSDSTIPPQCFYLRMLVDSNKIIFPTILSRGVNKLRGLILERKEMDFQHKYHILHIPEGMFTNLIHLRILCLRAIRVQQLPDTVGKLLVLRYLNLSQSEIQVLPESLCKLKNLRVLNLTYCEKLQKLPKRIHNLENLYILKLAYCTKLQMLPISVTNLVKLQELDLEGCQWLVELPEGLSNMKKLIDLNVYKCPLNQMPHEISHMSYLLKLSGYNVIGGLGNTFSKLQLLMNLKVLWLQNLEQVSKLGDASTLLKLHDVLPRLRYLRLNWKWDNTDDMRTSKLVSLQVLEGLQPNPNLKKLEIILYAGKEFPVWIKKGFDYHHKLEEIKLINLKRCKKLPSLGGLHDLKIIEISGMDLIDAMDEAFYGENENGTFPNLEKLILSDMPALEKWLKVERRRELLFPNLDELTIIQCPKFEALEVDLEVTRLSIWLDNKMLRTSEFKGWHNLQSMEHLEIVGCKEMRCLPQDMKRCVKLQKLRIIGCDNLDCLPEWLSELEDLDSLYICGCRALSSMPEELKRSPNVHVKGCPKL
ncbi:putative disease resistance protein RGA1 [Musa acuminata AAA Group]|uniref:putative disease resistance protein RGA1 n=1 Tax=Musa acuminata AAA Group TaxID=214697 RepID=UPI0031D70E88